MLGGFSHRSSEAYEDGSGTVFTEGANYLPSVDGVDAYNVNSAWARLYFEPAVGHEIHLSYGICVQTIFGHSDYATGGKGENKIR